MSTAKNINFTDEDVYQALGPHGAHGISAILSSLYWNKTDGKSLSTQYVAIKTAASRGGLSPTAVEKALERLVEAGRVHLMLGKDLQANGVSAYGMQSNHKAYVRDDTLKEGQARKAIQDKQYREGSARLEAERLVLGKYAAEVTSEYNRLLAETGTE